MDSNLFSLTLAVLIHWSGARCLIQQRDLDLELLVDSIALHVRARARATRLGAGVILPKHLLTAALSGNSAEYQYLLRDSYETPFYTPELVGDEFELRQLARGKPIAELS